MPSEKQTKEEPAPRKRTTTPRAPRRTLEVPVAEPVQETVIEPAPFEPVVKPEETFTFKATHFYAVLVVLAFAVGILIGYVAWGRAPQPVVIDPNAVAAAAPT